MNKNTDKLAELVERADNLREKLQGRLPSNIVFKFSAFVLGTSNFTWPERGVYLGLLFRLFAKGHLPEGTDQLAAFANMPVAAFNELWGSKLAEKFSELNGRLYNVTMLVEWVKQAEYLLGRRQIGSKGGKRSGEVR